VSGERGSVSVVLAAGILVVLVLVLGVADLGRVLAARSRARTASDAAALAVAQELAIPSGLDLQTLAADYAAANGATVVACTCEAGTWDAVVEVQVAVGDLRLVPGSPMVRARSRAVVEVPASPAPAG
jgi:secretion/DNA translocation related TadE-like protein